ncbi:Checkpoint kinase 2 [Mortierella sp. AD031]|nr:Checkpoint kinase 2 [Mortierella sp. AD031]
MLSSQAHPPSLSPASQSTQALSTFPPLEDMSSQALNEMVAKEKESIAGWLVKASTLETCLVIRKNKSATIGRHQTCDLVLSEDTISNRHCLFFTNSAGFVLCEDLSTNGTYWNGTLVGRGDSVILSHGDTIRFRNNYYFIFQDSTKEKLGHVDPEIGLVEKFYQILPRTLGKGTFAKVNLAVHRKSKMQLAVKIMDRIRYAKPEYSGGTDIENEVALLRTLRHANIVPVVDVIKTTQYVYIFMQLMSGGDLFDRLVRTGPLPELEAKFVAYQALLALQHLHGMSVSHRDIKPENILLTTSTKYPRILLSDFGMAREFNPKELMSTMCGTFAYMAPEVFDVKHAHSPGYDCAADCWSLGVTLYVILSGTHPFTPNYAIEDEKTMRIKMRSSKIEFPQKYWRGISAGARVLIQFLLKIGPDERWTVQDALASEWIQKDVAWLRTKYRENVLQTWLKSCQVLDGLALQRQLQQPELAFVHHGEKRSRREVDQQAGAAGAGAAAEGGGSRAKRAMKMPSLSVESEESPPPPSRSHRQPSTTHWTVTVPDIEGSW